MKQESSIPDLKAETDRGVGPYAQPLHRLCISLHRLFMSQNPGLAEQNRGLAVQNEILVLRYKTWHEQGRGTTVCNLALCLSIYRLLCLTDYS